ncbi:MAG: S8 family serine peptidase [Anaerolineales bacterium]|nr:S8 family serine peptidase [Anaerolineales bacterium]
MKKETNYLTMLSMLVVPVLVLLLVACGSEPDLTPSPTVASAPANTEQEATAEPTFSVTATSVPINTEPEVTESLITVTPSMIATSLPIDIVITDSSTISVTNLFEPSVIERVEQLHSEQVIVGEIVIIGNSAEFSEIDIPDLEGLDIIDLTTQDELGYLELSVEDFIQLNSEQLQSLPDNISFVDFSLTPSFLINPQVLLSNSFAGNQRVIIDEPDNGLLPALEAYFIENDIEHFTQTLLNGNVQLAWSTPTSIEALQLDKLLQVAIPQLLVQNIRSEVPPIVAAPWEVDGGPWEVDGGPWEVDGGPWEVDGGGFPRFEELNSDVDINPSFIANCNGEEFIAPWNQWALMIDGGIGLYDSNGNHLGCGDQDQQIDGDGSTVFILDSWPLDVTSEAIGTRITDTIAGGYNVHVSLPQLTTRNPDLQSECNRDSIQQRVEVESQRAEAQAAGNQETENQMEPWQDPINTGSVSRLTQEHGYFIAGLVHAIAPKADIEVYRILECDGKGSLLDLNSALREIYTRMSTEDLGKVIINLSLSVPFYELDGFNSDPYIYGRQFGELSDLLDALMNQGAVIVGAAGNGSYVASEQDIVDLRTDYNQVVNQPFSDSFLEMTSEWLLTTESGRYQINMPARFPSVIGVVSTDNTGQMSCFSNNSNLEHVVRAPGGNGSRASSEMTFSISIERGMRQLFNVRLPTEGRRVSIGLVCGPPLIHTRGQTVTVSGYDFSPVLASPLSNGKLGYWLGTSFSTGIVSGLAALVRDKCNDIGPPLVMRILEVANTNHITWGAIEENMCFQRDLTQIYFAQGASSIRIEGRTSTNAPLLYGFEASAAQTMTVTLTQGDGFSLNLWSSDGRLLATGDEEIVFELVEDGNHIVEIVTDNLSKAYELEVEITN